MSWLWLIHVRAILFYRLFLISQEIEETLDRPYTIHQFGRFVWTPRSLDLVKFITLPAITKRNKVTKLTRLSSVLFCGNNFAKAFLNIYLKIYLQIEISTRGEIKKKANIQCWVFSCNINHIFLLQYFINLS